MENAGYTLMAIGAIGIALAFPFLWFVYAAVAGLFVLLSKDLV